MKQLLIFLTVIISLFVSCKNSTGENSISDTLKQADTLSVNHEEQMEHVSEMKLNQGEKWAANAETTRGIERMRSLLESQPAEPNTKDDSLLKTKLEAEFNTILQKCTMTGEAHHQLHNYLLPMKQLINELDSESAEERREASDKLKNYLNEYDDYFQ